MPWEGNISWRREWLPLQYSFLENPMDRNLAEYGPWDLKKLDTTEVIEHACIHFSIIHLQHNFFLHSTTDAYIHCFHVQHNFFLHSKTDAYFHCFHMLGSPKQCCIKPWVGRVFSCPTEVQPGVGLPNHMVALFILFHGSFFLAS